MSSGAVEAIRCGTSPLIHRKLPGLGGAAGDNINGPSLIEAPPWLASPLGRYYLFFAHHRGDAIRLATADRLAGPWRVHQPGTLQRAQTAFTHIASPDVHVDERSRRLVMYFHGKPPGRGPQVTCVAMSEDGVRFEPHEEVLGPPYFRVFEHRGRYHALAKVAGGAMLVRASPGRGAFETGPELLPRCRHTAVMVRAGRLWVFFSRIGDAPEKLLVSQLDLEGDWLGWPASASEPVPLLEPREGWEGVRYPVEPSVPGPATGVCQVRDPAVFEEGGTTYLLYSGAGEEAIGMARLRFRAHAP